MEKSKHTLLFELQYAQRVCTLHHRLYRRIRAVLQFATLIGAAGAVKSVIAEKPETAAYSGIVLAVVAVIDQVLDPAGRAATYNEDYKRYTRLLRVARNLAAEAIQAEIDLLQEDDEPEIEALRPVAYNDVIEECGLDSGVKYRLSWWSKLVALVA